MTRQASVLVADDWTTTLSGKITIQGIYGTDLYIPADPFFANQLVFVFITETAPDDPFEKLELYVQMPGGDSRHLPINLSRLVQGLADQRRWCLKHPLLFTNPILRPGIIEAKVIHEKGEISTAAPYVTLREPKPQTT